MAALLRSFRLPPHYAAAFAAAGYDDVPFLRRLSGEAEELARLSEHVGFKPGHAARFGWALAQLGVGPGADFKIE